jgi:acyl-CoA reductase-like NAD-dependent aldehyde dehydrogenase
MLMMKLADLMEQNKELLATIDAWDNGQYNLRASLHRGRD